MSRTNEPDPSGSPVCDWTGGEPSRRSTPSPHRSRKSIAGSGMEGAMSDGMRDSLVVRSEKRMVARGSGDCWTRSVYAASLVSGYCRSMSRLHSASGKSSVQLFQTNIRSWKNRKCGLRFPCAPARIRFTSLRRRGRMPRRPQFLWQSYLRQPLLSLTYWSARNSQPAHAGLFALTGSRRKE